jgi:hypothetical protein
MFPGEIVTLSSRFFREATRFPVLELEEEIKLIRKELDVFL